MLRCSIAPLASNITPRDLVLPSLTQPHSASPAATPFTRNRSPRQGLNNVGNIGAVARTCEAFGVRQMHIVERCSVPHGPSKSKKDYQADVGAASWCDDCARAGLHCDVQFV